MQSQVAHTLMSDLKEIGTMLPEDSPAASITNQLMQQLESFTTNAQHFADAHTAKLTASSTSDGLEMVKALQYWLRANAAEKDMLALSRRLQHAINLEAEGLATEPGVINSIFTSHRLTQLADLLGIVPSLAESKAPMQAVTEIAKAHSSTVHHLLGEASAILDDASTRQKQFEQMNATQALVASVAGKAADLLSDVQAKAVGRRQQKYQCQLLRHFASHLLSRIDLVIASANFAITRAAGNKIQRDGAIESVARQQRFETFISEGLKALAPVLSSRGISPDEAVEVALLLGPEMLNGLALELTGSALQPHKDSDESTVDPEDETLRLMDLQQMLRHQAASDQPEDLNGNVDAPELPTNDTTDNNGSQAPPESQDP